MRDVARLPQTDLRDLFRETGQLMQIRESIVEKDFWVCWVLDYLFRQSRWQDKLIFKGGTSLSKAFGVIQRFSEDVDLILDWSLLGCTEREAFQARSGKKQSQFCDEMSQKTVEFLKEDFVPVVESELSKYSGGTVTVKQEQQVVMVEYPRSFSTDYIRPEIILEIGPKALHLPNEPADIRSYAAEKFPNQFRVPSTTVCTVSAERTFWEKATILHQEAHRTAEKSLPLRYSRHYYDLYQLSKSRVLPKAMEQIHLLQVVAKFKMKFFRCPWANYEEAKPGTLRLLPAECNLKELMKDYDSMRSMLFGEVPDFEAIIDELANLESQINSTTKRPDK